MVFAPASAERVEPCWASAGQQVALLPRLPLCPGSVPPPCGSCSPVPLHPHLYPLESWPQHTAVLRQPIPTLKRSSLIPETAPDCHCVSTPAYWLLLWQNSSHWPPAFLSPSPWLRLVSSHHCCCQGCLSKPMSLFSFSVSHCNLLGRS